MNKAFHALLVLLIPYTGFTQPALPPQMADSLWNVWEDENQPDTARLAAIEDYAWHGYLFTQPDSAFYYAQCEYEYAKKKGMKKQMARALRTQGVSLTVQGDYDKAIDYYTRGLKVNEEIGNKEGIAATLINMGMVYGRKGEYAKVIDLNTRSLKINEEIGNKKGVASCLNNLGNVYREQGNFAKAIDSYTRSLKINEEVGDQRAIAGCLSNIASIYQAQEDYTKAIERCTRSLEIFEKIEDKRGIAMSLSHFGNIYEEQGEYDKALDFYTRSLRIEEEIGNKPSFATCLSNIGNIYKEQGDYAKALDYYARGLKISEEIGDQQGIAHSLDMIGNIYYEQGDYARALDYSSRALLIAQEVGAVIETRNAGQSLWKANKKLGRYGEALAMHELYISMRDSMQSEENEKEVIRQEYKYEYEKQAALDSVEHAKAQQLSSATIAQREAEIKAQRNQQIALYGGVGLLLLFGGFMYNRYRVTQKQKVTIEKQKGEVEQQKEIIEEAHKEITDSIQYAKRIQSAILPPPKLVKEYLPESFILYKPKDVVAGDFYWMEPVGNTVLFAAADCTGHGVPGAMVSVVCNNGLNRSVREHNLTDPGEILTQTREIVIEEFEKSEEDVKDGMDIALCSLQGNKLVYAGANNPLWIIRNGEVLETKANKQPIGKFDNPQPYTSHNFELQQGDTVYLFSDGYADQFGGEKGKKYKSGNFKKFLVSIQHLSMAEQQTRLEQEFDRWRGELEQIDDVCVIGVRG